MKKLFAMLVALSMLLSCTALAAPIPQTTAQMYINPQLVAGMDEATKTLVDTVNSLYFTVTEGENYTTVAYGANETQIEEYTVAATDEGGMLLLSSLYPNTAILLDFAKVAELVQSVIPVDVDEIALSAMETVNAAAGMLAPYMEDVSMLLNQLQSEALSDDAGATMYIEVTSQHLGTLVDAWLTRLSADEELKSLIETVLFMFSAQLGEMPALSEMIEMLQYEANVLKTNEPVVLGTVGVFENNGVSSVEITLIDQLLISMDVYDYEGLACVDLLLLTNMTGGLSWQEAYDGVFDGSNSADVILGMSVAGDAEYQFLDLYAIQTGQIVDASMEMIIENADTAEQKVTTILSLDVEDGENSINLGGIAAETVLVEDAGMPSVEDKYVLDVAALPIDMLMNGLPQYAENIVAAMPGAVQLVIDALSQVEGLEFLQGIVVDVEETDTEVVTDEIDVKENNNAADVNEIEDLVETSTPTIVPDDEIAPQEAPKTEGMIEDM